MKHPCGRSAHAHFYDLNELFVGNRFVEQGYGTIGDGAIFAFGRIGPGNEDDWNGAGLAEATDPGHDLETIPGDQAAVGHVWREVDVEYDEIRKLIAHGADGLGGVDGGDGRVAPGPKFRRHGLKYDRVVINDKNLLRASSSPKGDCRVEPQG